MSTNRIRIGTINGSDIFAVKDESGEIFVPIKPICKAIGIAEETQIKKISEDEDLCSTATLRVAVASDGKEREMLSLPLKYACGWLFTINPKNVAPEAKDSVRKYKGQCYDILYRHFFAGSSKLIEANKAEIEYLEKLRQLLSEEKQIKSQIAETKSNIDKIRAARLDDAPSLFD